VLDTVVVGTVVIAELFFSRPVSFVGVQEVREQTTVRVAILFVQENVLLHADIFLIPGTSFVGFDLSLHIAVGHVALLLY
jgi:hypothetical protein